MNAIAAGSTLCDGRYRLDSVIGRGGMAVVWRAADVQLERTVAIKIISDVLATDPRFVARFEREARLAAGLSHPNLVKVFDFSVDEQRPLLIMEYIGGGTLAEARGRGLDTERIARALLDAVAHIHAAGILHRDIKPANVLVGSEGSPRLTDFGIARSDETAGLTQTGQILGTLRYIAPEVAAGERATPQSDLYSLGVLLGEFAGDDSPPALADLIGRMSERDPSRRPASARDALAELDPTAMLPPTAPLGESGYPHPTAVAGAGAPDPAAPAGTGAPDPAVPAPNGDAPIRAARRSGYGLAGFALRRSHAVLAAAVLVVVLLIVVIAATSGGKSKLDVSQPATTVIPAPENAPASTQIDQLEKIVRAAPQRP